jgi:hypothetical protein
MRWLSGLGISIKLSKGSVKGERIYHLYRSSVVLMILTIERSTAVEAAHENVQRH